MVDKSSKVRVIIQHKKAGANPVCRALDASGRKKYKYKYSKLLSNISNTRKRALIQYAGPDPLLH